MRTEHHAVVLRDVNDAMLGLDGHATQLDVLRLRRTDAGVFLDIGKSVSRLHGIKHMH